MSRADMRIAILGAGMSGLCVAAKLKEAGYRDITIFEKSDGVGGTWRDNTYPGCGCDVPSHLYSYSFYANPDWDYKWSLQPQILKYFEDFADTFDLRKLCKFNTEITACAYQSETGKWRLKDALGEELEFDAVVSGLGQLNIPRIPEFEGKDRFKGASFHSARWNHSIDIDGKTIAVIGNGPSAVQFLPEIQKRAGHVINFQRSPAWCRPRGQREYTAKDKSNFEKQRWRMNWYRWRIRWYADFGFGAFKSKSPMGMAKSLRKMCADHLEDQVKDPALRRLLTPDFEPGCKRILISDDYYPALAKPNVTVLRQGIKEIREEGIVGDDGETYPCDAIIYSTGFQSTEFLTPMKVIGRDDQNLQDVWRPGAEAFKGVAVSGFPNFFMLYGPNTNLGHNSIILMVEHQVGYIVQCLNKIAEDKVVSIDVTPSAMRRYNEELQSDLGQTVWAGDCASWYKNDAGKITNNWSGTTTAYRDLMRKPEWSNWQVMRDT